MKLEIISHAKSGAEEYMFLSEIDNKFQLATYIGEAYAMGPTIGDCTYEVSFFLKITWLHTFTTAVCDATSKKLLAEKS